MKPLIVLPLVLFALAAPVVACLGATDLPTRAGEAEALYQHALRELSRGTIEGRRIAIEDLEQATLLAPATAEYELTLARTYYRVGFLRSARKRFERVTRLAPRDAGARFGLGQVWRRDWMKYLDRSSLERAVENFSLAARMDPTLTDGWLQLATLLIEQTNLRAAAEAAARALECAPERPETQLMAAQAAFRLGDVERAESLFVGAIPRLERIVRWCYEDIGPLATEEDTVRLRHLPRAQRAEFVRRFWKEHDPDPTTPENEVQLEYWTRVTQAYFLFFDPKRRAWDERGEVYVRYGPPEAAEYNPLGSTSRVHFGTFGDYPVNSLVWDYPSLGMKVTLQDRILSEYYLLPMSLYEDLDPRPDPDSLARHGDQLATRGGRGVFRTLPPGIKALPVEGVLSRFEGDDGPRLLAQLEAPGAPGDSLWADWVVLDTSETEVRRGRTTLSPSPCDAATRRVADFDAALPPGHYRVGVSVQGTGRRRGVFRAPVDLYPPAPELALSDVVVSCGAPDVTSGAVRLAANPARRVEGNDPLTAYFEIYHLRPGARGQARFEYVYTVRSAERDRRIWIQRALQPRPQVPPISASREEDNPGSLRRQYVSVPVQSLPAGRYRLEIRVRDLLAGTVAAREAGFVHVAPSAANTDTIPGGPARN